jgi:hypothetical protein
MSEWRLHRSGRSRLVRAVLAEREDEWAAAAATRGIPAVTEPPRALSLPGCSVRSRALGQAQRVRVGNTAP